MNMRVSHSLHHAASTHLNLLVFIDLLCKADCADNGTDLDETDQHSDESKGENRVLSLVVHSLSAALVRRMTFSLYTDLQSGRESGSHQC